MLHAEPIDIIYPAFMRSSLSFTLQNGSPIFLHIANNIVFGRRFSESIDGPINTNSIALCLIVL